MKSKIFVVTHKSVPKLIKKRGYSYIQVNAKINGELGFEYNDAVKNNISNKNQNYCELTALYWIWKNYKCSQDTILGICHYRRFFLSNKIRTKKNILDISKAKKILNNFDIIVPKKNCFPITTYEYYDYGEGKKKDLDNVKMIIKKIYPDYLESLNWYYNQNNGHYCNMMICKKSIFDDYCNWLFDILFELEKITDLNNYTKAEARIYGYISELLLNVYIHKNNLNIKELPFINTEETLSFKFKNKIRKILEKK